MSLNIAVILIRGAFVVCFLAQEDVTSTSIDKRVVVENIVASHKKIREDFRPTRVVYSLEECEAPGQKKVTQSKEFLRRGGSTVVTTESEIWGTNDRYDFNIQRKEPQAPWHISDVQRRFGKALSSTGTVITLAQNVFTESLTANHIPIDELLTHPESEIISCSRTHAPDGRGVRIEVKLKNPAAKLKSGLDIRFAKATLFFTPEASGWIPTKVVMIGPKNDGLTFLNSNFTKIDGQFLPLQRTLTGKLANGTEWELAKSISTFSFEEVPEKVFYLSHYGLPEPDFGVRRRPYRLWLVIPCLVLVGIAVFYLVRRRRVAS